MKTLFASVCLIVYTCLQIGAYMPQIVKILKTKRADDLSLTSWCTWVFGDLCYLAYVLLESPDIGVILVTCIDLSFIITVLLLTMYYQKHNRRKRSCR